MTIADAARLLQVTPRSIHNLVKRDRLKQVNISQRMVRIQRASLMKLIGEPVA